MKADGEVGAIGAVGKNRHGEEIEAPVTGPNLNRKTSALVLQVKRYSGEIRKLSKLSDIGLWHSFELLKAVCVQLEGAPRLHILN